MCTWTYINPNITLVYQSLGVVFLYITDLQIDALDNPDLAHDFSTFDIAALDNPDLAHDFSTFDIAEYYQLHIGIEQIRVPELLFQPSMIGVEQGGLSETLTYVLNKYPSDKQVELASE